MEFFVIKTLNNEYINDEGFTRHIENAKFYKTVLEAENISKYIKCPTIISSVYIYPEDIE